MKIRIILLLMLSAAITLSFTFFNTQTSKKVNVQQTSRSISTETLGGFVSESNL